MKKVVEGTKSWFATKVNGIGILLIVCEVLGAAVGGVATWLLTKLIFKSEEN